MSDHEKDKHGHEGGGSHGGGSHGGGGHGHGPGGGGHEEGHEGAPEWLISFADMVMLIMGFFVILLAMNMGPKATAVQGGEPSEKDNHEEMMQARHADFVISVREGFNNKIDPFGSDPSEAWLRKRIRDRFEGSTNQPGPHGDHPNLQAIRPTDYNRVTARVPFDDGSATISVDAREVIASAAVGLRDHRWIVDVRGHVSPFEAMRNTRAARQLAFDRAYAVAQVLVENGVSWDNIRVSSLGETDRVVPKTFDREKDRANQRVEIVQTDEPLPESPHARASDDR
ncbi:MAG: OmpA family protein [Phycisphaeraceae bacterium]|nr:MAG: OmpA family protein [Phycisphaeraceae bacterium]